MAVCGRPSATGAVTRHMNEEEDFTRVDGVPTGRMGISRDDR